MKTSTFFSHFAILVLSTSLGTSRGASKYVDKGDNCKADAKKGKCDSDPIYMIEHCEKSCMKLVEAEGPADCPKLVEEGRCKTRTLYMVQHCEDECMAWASAKMSTTGTQSTTFSDGRTITTKPKSSEAMKRQEAVKEATSCPVLVEKGFCRTKPTHMLANCKDECAKWMSEKERHDTFNIDEDDKTFYELSAKTATGETMNFEKFEDYIVIVVNMVKGCKSKIPTKEEAEKFFQTMEAIRNVSPYAIELLGFPYEHPKLDYSKEDCKDFDEASKKPRPVHIMEPVKIDGPDTHPVFKYLYEKAGIATLETDIATFFVMSAGGDKLEVHYGTSLASLMAHLRARLKDYEL